MPTPEPIATPVPVNAQRERIESDAYIAVEELIFAVGIKFTLTGKLTSIPQAGREYEMPDLLHELHFFLKYLLSLHLGK